MLVQSHSIWKISGPTGTSSHADRQAETLQHRHLVLVFSKKMTENIEFSLTSGKTNKQANKTYFHSHKYFLCQHGELYG